MEANSQTVDTVHVAVETSLKSVSLISGHLLLYRRKDVGYVEQHFVSSGYVCDLWGTLRSCI